MYFPGDPLIPLDPIAMAIPEFARNRLISSLDIAETVPDFALAYKFDIVLRGRNATPEDPD
jgi:protocatechuate 3,4-dioxygenase, beta subunit